MKSLTIDSRNSTAASISQLLRRFFPKLRCLAFGHKISNATPAAQQIAPRKCPCGAPILDEDGRETRVSHTLSCFFFGHDYIKMGERDGHSEYVCEVCGHPLLVDSSRSPYTNRHAFRKKVRFLCIVKGHQLHTVVDRNGLTEYACHCGHSFLRPEHGRTNFRHPLICVYKGHFISFIMRRECYDEFRCRNCGHPFYFIAPESDRTPIAINR